MRAVNVVSRSPVVKSSNLDPFEVKTEISDTQTRADRKLSLPPCMSLAYA
jgi:hypothetical protein